MFERFDRREKMIEIISGLFKPQLHTIKLLKKSSRVRFRTFLMSKTKNQIFRYGFSPGNSTHLPDERDGVPL